MKTTIIASLLFLASCGGEEPLCLIVKTIPICGPEYECQAGTCRDCPTESLYCADCPPGEAFDGSCWHDGAAYECIEECPY